MSSMDISDLLTPDTVIGNLRAVSKKQVLQELAAKAGDAAGTDSRAIFNVLAERERLGTTGVGQGIAIPHGKLDSIKQIQGVFARLNKPVDFDSVDDEPVDLVFLLLAPNSRSAGADHLKALARVSRLLRDEKMRAKLRGASDAEALFSLLINDQETLSASGRTRKTRTQ